MHYCSVLCAGMTSINKPITHYRTTKSEIPVSTPILQ